jgi:ribosomal protein S18 acetylase RimI-like enzyme
MSLGLIALRPAHQDDAVSLAAVHEEAWRATYRGIIDGRELERMISKRGPKWWRTALSRGVQIQILHVAGTPAGYATFGRSRMRELPFEGEIYELYIRPDHQGLGFGTELFHAARGALARSRMSGLAIRVLRDNEDALRFYRHRGGQVLLTTRERIANSALDLTVFGWFADDDANRPRP